ncbi:MAG TPA: c-type cytochrome [Terriglobales bacterium]|nr:c-type cytochrome [Terriglobales bacterium]
MRYAVLLAPALFVVCLAGAQTSPAVDDTLPSNYVPSGKVMFKQYCASCHGIDAKGQGPLATMLKVPPANLTTLAKRHEGKFPYDYVADVLRFGPGPTVLHGSSDMPTWGPIFEYLDKNDEDAVKQRIKNLCNYLASLQDE